MDQFMGNLFFRGVQTNLINDMDYFEMREWNKWHDRMNKQTDKTVREINKKSGN